MVHAIGQSRASPLCAWCDGISEVIVGRFERATNESARARNLVRADFNLGNVTSRSRCRWHRQRRLQSRFGCRDWLNRRSRRDFRRRFWGRFGSGGCCRFRLGSLGWSLRFRVLTQNWFGWNQTLFRSRRTSVCRDRLKIGNRFQPRCHGFQRWLILQRGSRS